MGESNSADKTTDNFMNKFQYLYNKHFPIMTKNANKKRLNKPWLSISIIKSIRDKHLKYKQCKLGLLSKYSYNLYSNTLSKLIKKAKNYILIESLIQSVVV